MPPLVCEAGRTAKVFANFGPTIRLTVTWSKFCNFVSCKHTMVEAVSLTSRFTASCLTTSLRPRTFQERMLQLCYDIGAGCEPIEKQLDTKPEQSRAQRYNTEATILIAGGTSALPRSIQLAPGALKIGCLSCWKEHWEDCITVMEGKLLTPYLWRLRRRPGAPGQHPCSPSR